MISIRPVLSPVVFTAAMALTTASGGTDLSATATEGAGESGSSRTLWDQLSICCNGWNGTASTEQSGFVTAAADDFTVPKGRTWIVNEVQVAGSYSQGSPRATSEHVTFYRSVHGLPGDAVADYDNLPGVQPQRGWFNIAIPDTSLPAGIYWVSVVAHMSDGEWFWENLSETVVDHWAAFEGGNGDSPCGRTWGHQDKCFPDGPQLGDQMFALKGRQEAAE
jgi:hypothetical protein